MNIVCLGGGPAGLYFGLLMKLRHPEHHITVLEAAEFRTLYIHKSRTPKGWTGCRVIVVSPVLREAVHALDTSPTIYRHMKRRVLPWGGPAAKP